MEMHHYIAFFALLLSISLISMNKSCEFTNNIDLEQDIFVYREFKPARYPAFNWSFL
jgi:hypothetical protein